MAVEYAFVSSGVKNVKVLLALAIFASAGCMRKSDPSPELGRIAEEYVKLALALGTHDANYVDAYYGPASWKTDAAHSPPSLENIQARASTLVSELQLVDVAGSEELIQLRRQYLVKQLQSMKARAEILAGKKMTFDEESAALYDAVEPPHSAAEFQTVLDQIEPLLPGSGSLAARYEAFQKRFAVPREKLEKVFRAGVDEARRRTKEHISLPSNENFAIEYVQGQVWSAYNWYKGNAQSLIQVNTDLPVDVDFVIRLACHEGYPGHHVYNALLEDRLVRKRNWIEFTVYPLYSPQSLIAEGTADLGVDLAFPPAERLAFQKEVLFPLAGLDPATAALHQRVQSLMAKLGYAVDEGARRYLDGAITRDQAIEWLSKYALQSPQRAQQQIRFIEQNRAYVINYRLGKDLARQYLDRLGATATHPDLEWREFEKLLSSPRLPSGLR